MKDTPLDSIASALDRGDAIPYLGPGLLSFDGAVRQLPDSQKALVGHLTSKSNVPHKVRNNLGAAAQFIENFKHRSTVTDAMTEAFSVEAQPTRMHTLLMSHARAAIGCSRMVRRSSAKSPSLAFKLGYGAGRKPGGALRQLDPLLHRRTAHTQELETDKSHAEWNTLLYQPLGSVWPARNYLSLRLRLC